MSHPYLLHGRLRCLRFIRLAMVLFAWTLGVAHGQTSIVEVDQRPLVIKCDDAVGTARDRSMAHTVAGLASNATGASAGTMIYQAGYDPAGWSGDLRAFPMVDGKRQPEPRWSAAAVLPKAASRPVYTSSGGSAVAFASTHFKRLSAAQQAALGGAEQGSVIIDYLRGDASQEQRNGGALRNRKSALGDVVNAEPVFVGAPDPNAFQGQNFKASAIYVEYARAWQKRAQRVLVAANDGMLHAFAADVGVETYAYLPGAVITAGLKSLADPGYGSDALPHQYFNDGELSVADVYDNASKAWRTVAVGTTGRGKARAIYALDITDPAAYAWLWERSAGDGLGNDGDIGQMIGKPVIAQTDDGVWSVLIGNGYNSARGTAALLQFGVTDGSLTVHATDAVAGNGLAAPAVWIGTAANGISTVAYAGDLKGRVWKFVLNDGTAMPRSGGSRVFTATSATGTSLPITGGMLMGRDPATGNLWLFFGTGRYLSMTDMQDPTPQSWFGLIVSSYTNMLADKLADTGRKSLLARRIVMEETSRRSTSTAAAGDIDGKSGWVIDLVSPVKGEQGERMVLPNSFSHRSLIGTTRIPPSEGECGGSGSGWTMSVDPFTGAAPKVDVSGTEGGDFVDEPDSDAASEGGGRNGVRHDALPHGPRLIGNVLYVTAADGTLSDIPLSAGSNEPERISWRELGNP